MLKSGKSKYEINTNLPLARARHLKSDVCFLRVKDKVSSLTFKFSRDLSLAKSFLFIFSLILTWPRTSSLKGGWFELKFEL